MFGKRSNKKSSKKKSKHLLKQVIKAQKILGQSLDNHDYQQKYQKKSAIDPNALFGSGRFATLIITDKKRCRKQLAKLQDTGNFW